MFGCAGQQAGGNKSQKYCVYCYKDGKFTDPDMTGEQMRDFAYKMLCKKHWPGFLAKMVTNNIPKLERWQKS